MPNIDVRKSVARAAAWDGFAQRCGASFRCAYRATRVWQYEVSPTHKLCRFELFVDDNGHAVKIGQCAVGVSPTINSFADSIQLLPEYADMWQHAMKAVLTRLGPGIYNYGSDFNIEDSREGDLQQLKAVKIDHVDNFFIEYVDFKQWPEWDAYYKSISENVRRNIKKAAKHYENYQINATSGFDVRRIFKFLTLRNKVYSRKKIQKAPAIVFLRSFLRAFAVPQYTNYAYFEYGKKIVAGYCGVDFGRNIYYMEGGSEKDNQGASWSLLIGMMSRAWKQSQGQGRFVMGANSTEAHEESWAGLERSRKQCRVSEQTTSIIKFTYEGETAKVPALTPAQRLACLTPSSLIITAFSHKQSQVARFVLMIGAYLLLYRWRSY